MVGDVSMALFDDCPADGFRCGSSTRDAARTVRDDDHGAVFHGNDLHTIFSAPWPGVFPFRCPMPQHD